jgi:hypothetical protein
MPSRCFNLNLGPRRRNPSIIARSRSFRPLCNIPCYLGPGYPFLETILVALCLRSSHLMDGVIVGETCAQIPDRDGNFSAAGPSGENIVIFLPGARRSNHALGKCAPGFKQFGDYYYYYDLSAAQSEGAADSDCKSKPRLESRSLEVRLLLNCPHFAVLGQSSWSNTNSNSILEFLTIS